MINTSTWYCVACDVCGEELDDDEAGCHGTTPAAALAIARDLDCWWIGTDDTVVCEMRDWDHLAKARALAATLDDESERNAFMHTWPELDLTEHGPRFATIMPGQTDLLAATGTDTK